MTSDFDKAAKLTSNGQSVGPLQAWTAVRESTIALMLEEGLTPDHFVVDLGCGHLRHGSFLVPYLLRGRYHGIEPRENVRRAGCQAFLTAEIMENKAPTFSENTDFDVGVNGRVDMVVARSVWSHASRDQIRATLDSFRNSMTPTGKLLASYYPVDWTCRHLWPYYGNRWLYAGETRRPMSAHFRGFIKREAAKRGLKARFRRIEGVHQEWCILEAAHV